MPVKIPAGVDVTIGSGQVTVKGPLGALNRGLPEGIALKRDGDVVVVDLGGDDSIRSNAMSGTVRALLANMVSGVTKGFERKLTLVGVGYRAQAQGDKLNLTLGFSHPVVHQMPKGVKVETPTQTEILVKGLDKQQVGQVAAEIRAYRPPEPYKGKGVRYADEVVVIKETKKK
jgi:large subunit ribosomal protein L6